ncbi:MAG: ABC-2 family transporter protein [Cellulosilyticum sp.]|nr:ABC-2 family transporter protein [Cellulosilyticum sp.]
MIKRYSRLYKVLISQFFKVIMQSKVDFLMGLLGFFLTQILGIVFLYLIFDKIELLNGWSFEQLIFIYGFAQIPRGIDHLLTDNIWLVAWRWVISGDIDRYMLRPMNILFQIISEKLQPDALGEILIGCILVAKSISAGVSHITITNVILFFLSIIAGTIIYTSIKLFFASLAFWVKISGPFVQFAYQMADFAKYPTEIYTKSIGFIITWVIPFAFVAYLPASYFLGVENSLGIGAYIIGVEWIIAIILGIISYNMFQKGLTVYESAGN